MRVCLINAAVLGRMPAAQVLAGSGVDTFPAEGGGGPAGTTGGAVSTPGGGAAAGAGTEGPAQPMVSLGTGLAPITKRMADRIKAGEYIDFSELPPAKGKARSVPQSLEGQVIVVQAADLLQDRKLIPDLATWTQCFALYTAVVASHDPGRVPDLMAYQSLVARTSRKYKWPSWLVYDQNFRQEAAGHPGICWAKVDPSIYTQCFTGQEITAENWCGRCQGLDHATPNCPHQSRKRPWSAVNSPSASGGMPSSHPAASRGPQQVCLKFNRYQGDCLFGKECRYQHVCSACRGPHPVSKCNAARK